MINLFMVEQFIIRGGRPLQGKIAVRGSKNAASKMMIASLLTAEPCVIDNMPLSVEIDITKELCEKIGSEVSFKEHRLVIKTERVRTPLVSELTRRNRIPILALGPLLHRRGFAEVPVAGGCPIGHRPVNLHVEALAKMGANIERRTDSYYAQTNGLRGAEIEFLHSSVGATENVVLAATLARGKTVIKNAAVEPEIIHLIGMLCSMGALIDVDSANRYIEIQGVAKLRGTTIRVMPDRNEVVSFALTALATGGELEILGIEDWYLKSFLEKVKALGADYAIFPNSLKFTGRNKYDPLNIETAPHPGFMTDWQQPMGVLLTQARGESIIHETVYEDRFGYAKDLNKLGAKIQVSDYCLGNPCQFSGQHFKHSARIMGSSELQGGDLTITDIRAGIAHIIAALLAKGESVISGVEHIDRGYEKLDERLSELGADIKRIEN